MSIGEPILLLAAIWCTIHALHYFWSRKTSSLLPTLAAPNTGPNWQRSGTNVSLNNFQLKILTTKWNAYHDKLSAFLSRRKNKKVDLLLQWVYSLGTVLGAIGMLLAIGALLWISAASVWTLLRRISVKELKNSGTPRLVRRVSEDTAIAHQSAPSRFPNITPIIPGVTVPLGDLPVIIFAVFVCQIIHEFGHAIAAAHESLPMISAGISFTFCIPAAFVAFPVSPMKNLTAKARLRVIAAGPFHNLIFWCFLVLVVRLELVNMVSYFSGYKNISNVGKAVVGVSADSSLTLHLRLGSIITQLDDVSLGTSLAPGDRWSDYLTGKTEKSSLGWCVAKSVFGKSDACCSLINKKQSPFMCFISHDSTVRGCVDPVPIMTIPSGHGRCKSTAGCPSESTCVMPHEQSQLTRLSVHSSKSEPGTETIVLWNGPPSEIWEEVQVSNWLPRIWLLPLGFPLLLEAFWDYLTMATLSLYLFNLLPLPHLDGTELLSSILDAVFDKDITAFSFDIEALEGGEYQEENIRTRQRWKDRVIKYVPMSLTCLVIWCILFWTMNAMY